MARLDVIRSQNHVMFMGWNKSSHKTKYVAPNVMYNNVIVHYKLPDYFSLILTPPQMSIIVYHIRVV